MMAGITSWAKRGVASQHVLLTGFRLGTQRSIALYDTSPPTRITVGSTFMAMAS